MSRRRSFFPPPPRGLRGRTQELRHLEARIAAGAPRLALVGGGGTGKSMLACALGHRVRGRFPGGVHWLRVGGWDPRTILEMLARRLGASGDDRPAAVRAAWEARGRSLVVLDNHENDRALARFLDGMRGSPVVWVITARRCLLSGVEVFPVIAPLVAGGGAAFPRVAPLTALLRWNPLALAIADALVGSRAVGVATLRSWLLEGGAERVAVMEHEDDVVEVRLLIDWAWPRLPAGARRMMGVLAHSEGDDVDEASLRRLAGVPATDRAALGALRRWCLVQEPLAGRFTLHAVVRYFVARRTHVAPERYFRHYVALLEREPHRLDVEQTHLFAAMDHAHTTSDLQAFLRVERLLDGVANGGAR